MSNNINRRSFLSGFAGLALSQMLFKENALAGDQILHHPPRVKRVVQLFMAGACSHIDTFDYKPLLEKQNGKPWNPGEKVELFQSSPGATLASPWKFTPYGQSKKYLSDIVSDFGEVVDDMAFIHNVSGQTGVHSQGTLLQTTGFNFPGYPSAGAWISYALGSENENLPTFIVLPDHRGYASNGAKNWSTAFLPASHQGTVIRPGSRTPIADLYPPQSQFINNKSDKDGLTALNLLNKEFSNNNPEDDRLSARVRSYELAAAMQLSATNALDLKTEPQYIKDMYGLNENVSDKKINAKAETEFFGRKCLVARRLLERGVRFVQIWSGNDNGHPRRNWDSHEDIKREHEPLARGMARGASALIKDLKQRGMLDDTLVLWTTEFGRMPCSQGSKGRDHNPFTFTNWMCGGGIKGGTYGHSDEWGFRPRDKKVEIYDINATMLHLLGIDHERLTVRHNGIDQRLTSVHGHVLKNLIG